jgi:hypothetical protein
MSKRFGLRLISSACGLLLCLVLVPAASGRAADAPQENPAHLHHILMVTQSAGYQHSSITRKGGELSFAEEVVIKLGISSGLFKVDCTKDAAKEMTKENLAHYDIVFFYTTGDLKIPKEALDYFFHDWLKQRGHGFIGVHSATDTYHGNKDYLEMIGGEFQEHPWGNGSKVWIKVHDKDFPAMKPWGDEFEIADEIYRFKNFQADKVHVLMSMDMAKTEHKAPYHEPIAWCRDYGQGKVFYISLGHDEKVWANPKYQACLLGAIKWELNLEPGDATPNPELSKAQDEKAKTDFAAAKSGGK